MGPRFESVPGEAVTLTPEIVRAMTPEERALWEDAVGKPMLDAIASGDSESAELHGASR